MSPHEKPENTTVVCAEVTRQVDNPAQQVVDDLVKIGFIEPTDVLDTKVMREEYAYPVYRREYEETLANAMSQLEQYTNLHLVGRSAEFKHREVDDCFGSAVAKVKQILPLIEHDSAEFENVSEEDVIRQLFLQP